MKWIFAGVAAGLAWWYFQNLSPAVATDSNDFAIDPFAPVVNDAGDFAIDPFAPYQFDPVSGAASTGTTNGVQAFALAIANAEGFGIAGAIPTRANNPGDLVIPGWPGQRIGAEGISVFIDVETGWSRLYDQLQRIADGRSTVYYSLMTIGEMGDKWTSTDSGDWSRNVAAFLTSRGFPATIDTTLGEILYA